MQINLIWSIKTWAN